MDIQKDVVCGMNIDSKTAQFKSDYKEKTYYFCSESCKKQFDESPEYFVDKKQPNGNVE